MLELYHGGAWLMVYTSGAVSIEHEGVARVCTINHKPRHVQCNRAGPYLGTDCARGYQIAAWRRSRALQLEKTLSRLPLRVTQLSRCYLC